MKLLKKLAAVALAAVLALSMVGCGNASGVNYTKQFMLNMMADSVAMYGGECHNTPDMDGIAQKLLTEANAAYQGETQTNKAVKALLNVAVEKMRKEGDLNAGTGYGIEFVEDYQFRSSFIPDAEKQAALIRNMEYIPVNGGIDDDDDEADELDIGVAVGKIGDKTYVVMVMMPTETATTPGTGN